MLELIDVKLLLLEIEDIILLDDLFSNFNNWWLHISTGTFKNCNNFCSIDSKGIGTKCVWSQDY